MTNPAVRELLERSNRLGADPRNTNYAGGNTSAKGTETTDTFSLKGLSQALDRLAQDCKR